MGDKEIEDTYAPPNYLIPLATNTRSTKTLCLLFEMTIRHLKTRFIVIIPSGQYVDKNNCTLPVRDGKEWEGTGKPLKTLGGCNFRKGNYLRFCRESVSQCGGQGFDPPPPPITFNSSYLQPSCERHVRNAELWCHERRQMKTADALFRG